MLAVLVLFDESGDELHNFVLLTSGELRNVLPGGVTHQKVIVSYLSNFVTLLLDPVERQHYSQMQSASLFLSLQGLSPRPGQGPDISYQ